MLILSDADVAVDLVGTDAVFQLVIIHIASNHLLKGIGESSKIVPILTENCFQHPRQFQRF